jgi:microcystin-dependent protein
MAGFLDLTGLSRFKSKLLEAIANVYVTKTAHSKALNLKVNKADLESEIKRVLGTLDTGIPVGAIMAFHDVPAGWLQCNGAAVSRTTYAALFAKIGTKYGSGNGSTTFNLPNLHHKFIEGTTTSSEVGKSVAAGLPNITGTFTEHGNTSELKCTRAFTGEARIGLHSNQGGARDGGRVTMNSSLSSSVYGAASTVQPASTRMLLCIKT